MLSKLTALGKGSGYGSHLRTTAIKHKSKGLTGDAFFSLLILQQFWSFSLKLQLEMKPVCPTTHNHNWGHAAKVKIEQILSNTLSVA